MRILLAEDNETNRNVALRMLESLGHAAEVVENGAEAVQRVLATPFDVVLMDIHMPIMDGLEATRRIRDAFVDNGCRPRIIAVTANVMENGPEQCHAQGMDGFVAKPLQMETLRRALEEGGEEEGESDSGDGASGALDVEQLVAVIDPADMECMEIFDDFCNGVADVLDGIAEEADRSDWPAVASRAHQLKGAAATMGFVALSNWAADLQAKAEMGEGSMPDGWREAEGARFAADREAAEAALGR